MTVGTRALAVALAAVLAAAVPAGALAADATPGPTAPPAVPAVLAAVDPASGTGPTTSGLTAALAAALKADGLGRSTGITVLDVATGTVLYDKGGSAQLTPASTTKVLTAAAILAAAGPDAVLHTTVMRAPQPGEATIAPDPTPPPPGVSGPAVVPVPVPITLVGGGDPLLSSLPPGSDKLPAYPRRATLDDLAARVADDLRDARVASVELTYDAGIFTGPVAAATWTRTYTGDVVGEVMGLSVDQARIGPLTGGRVNDPARRTAELFAAKLAKRGITVKGKPAPGRAPAGSETIADVVSAPISALVEHMLVESDNDVAEALLRQVAVFRGKPATFDGGAAAVLAELTALGVDVTGVQLYDGSGLSRANRIPPSVLARVLALAANGPQLQLRPLVAGLAVAGGNGTLAPRFTTAGASPARGVLRAKSGYLTGVVTLGGVLVDAAGRMLVFDVATDLVRPGFGLAARAALDRIAGILARCGCT